MFAKNYMKPGPGVEKRDPNQSRISIFFEIFGERFWDIVKLNLLYFLFSIPAFIITFIVTGFLSTSILNPMIDASSLSEDMVLPIYWLLNLIFAICFNALWGLGPSTAGLTYAFRNMGREEHVWLFSDFKQKIKENFKQSLALWALDLALFALIIFAYNFYGSMGGAFSYFRYVLIFFALVFTILHLFVYQLMITFKLPLKALFKDALILSLANAPKSFILLLMVILFHVVFPFIAIYIASPVVLIIYFALEIFLLPALTAFITNFSIYPIIEKYIKIAKQNEQ
ncbi:MAG: YesL family protein [Oscillospiraceae bacterium]|nr:YesL family protein [Oscillospiraceae bacterium]